MALTVSTAIGALFFVSGCATNTERVSSQVVNSSLNIQYEPPSLANDLSSVGLQRVFVDYWQAGAERDWKRRYAHEKFVHPVEEKFYVAYHLAAWRLVELSISDVKLAGQDADVVMSVTYVNPETQDKHVVKVFDKWTVRDDDWKHVVQDPMLAGLRQQ